MGSCFGNKIKELRTERGITQPELAKALGVSNGMVSLWENGVNAPKAEYIVSAARFFNVSADYLLGLEDEFGNKICSNTEKKE